MEHAEVVQEHGAEAGEGHWRILQNVRTWLLADEVARSTLVLPPAPDVEDLSRYLQVVAPMLERLDQLIRPADENGTAEQRYEPIAQTASTVAECAEDSGAYATGFGYAQVAAALGPAEPWRTYHVGRLARKAGRSNHALTWLRRARRIAQERDDADVLVLVLQGLGHVHRQGSRPGRARSYYRRAFEAARRQGRAALAGDMLADLCLAELESGNFSAALPHLEQALAFYETGDPGIVHLAQEAAWLLIEAYGDFHPALQVFDALLEHTWEPRSRIFLLAHRARAAAGVRLYREFERSWNEALTLAARPETHRVRAPALVHLSLSAILLQNFRRARHALSQASSDAEPGSLAARLWRALEGESPAEELLEALAPPAPSAAEEASARVLSTTVLARLRQRDRGDPFDASHQELRVRRGIPRGFAPDTRGTNEHAR